MFNNKRIMCIIMSVVLCGAVIYQQKIKTIETFLSYADYENQEGNMLLSDSYETQNPPTITANNSSNIYQSNPIFPARSNVNNNIRYWKRPTNGKCSRAEFCGNVYRDTYHDIPKEPTAPPSNRGRVNFYESSQNLC